MGTDIHMLVQKRESSNHPWINTVACLTCDTCTGTGKIDSYRNPGTREDCFWCNGKGTESAFRDRNYDLFAQLADVRNGRGFAGCDIGDGFIPIAPRRGLPEGVQAEPEGDDEAFGDMWLGDHSHSWLTLTELLAYDLERQSIHLGIVSYNTWLSWDRKGPPKEYCGGISGPGIRIISDADARISPTQDERTYVRVSWSETYREAGGRFWSEFVPALQALGAPDCVRIVFGFDS